jgi:gliding motility-associated-like protein
MIFLRFFSPNGDGPMISAVCTSPENLKKWKAFRYLTVAIYQRRSILKSNGWDGSFNGGSLPASDYWFKAIF